MTGRGSPLPGGDPAARPWYAGVMSTHAPEIASPQLTARPVSLWLAWAWCGLVAAVFLYRYWTYLDAGYSLSAKLASEGLAGVLRRLAGLGG